MRLLSFTVIFILLGLITSCSRVTEEKYEEIKQGMSMKQVIAIIGEPRSAQSINIAGISGTSAVWKSRDAEIDIQFLNDQVTIKAYRKMHPDENEVKPDNN